MIYNYKQIIMFKKFKKTRGENLINGYFLCSKNNVKQEVKFNIILDK